MSTETEIKKAKSIYATADKKTKTALEEIFGKTSLQLTPMEKIKELADAYPIFQAKDYKNDELLLKIQKRKPEDLSALEEQIIIAEALRGDWKPNYKDDKQKKWYGIFQIGGSGWAFGGSGYGCTDARAAAGSRFAFQDKETSDYFCTQFFSIHLRVLPNE